ncbi:hypothetical protein BC835DRAFT_1310318 [Cytidiella melzeri]|nr:hypothetical protein BC835DRAFT_1310318 [Cytidiella melzeri]
MSRHSSYAYENSPPPYRSVVSDDCDGEFRSSLSLPLKTPLLVIYGTRRVVIRRQPDYSATIAAVRDARTMETLKNESFHLEAVIPGCNSGGELCEVPEDIWSELVPFLQSVTVVLDNRAHPELDHTQAAPLVGGTAFQIPSPPYSRPTLSSFTSPASSRPSQVNDIREYISPHIMVKPLTGQNTLVSISSLDITVHELKSRIYATMGTPADQQRLIFAGKQMKDEQTLRKSGVLLGAIVDLRRIGMSWAELLDNTSSVSMQL